MDKNSGEDSDPESKSHYFIGGSVLKANTSDVSSSATATIKTTSVSSSQHQSTQESSCSNSDQKSAEESTESCETRKSVTTRKPVVFGNTLLVNPNQSANKLLKHLRIGYQMSDSISPAHYLMYDSCCAVFLSLKYHLIYHNYIYDKLDELKNSYHLKVLLVLVDHIEFQSALKELTKLAVRTNCTLMLAWSYEEAANYIENYRHFADKSADIIMGKTGANSNTTEDAFQCMAEALASIKSINKTDAISLINTFDSFDNIVNAEDDQLIICPGMAALKAQRLRQFFNKPFIRSE